MERTPKRKVQALLEEAKTLLGGEPKDVLHPVAQTIEWTLKRAGYSVSCAQFTPHTDSCWKFTFFLGVQFLSLPLDIGKLSTVKGCEAFTDEVVKAVRLKLADNDG